jgi:hypothetical protein
LKLSLSPLVMLHHPTGGYQHIRAIARDSFSDVICKAECLHVSGTTLDY